MSELVLVTGGAGYIGVPVCEALLASGRRVRALDVLLHGQSAIADGLEENGVEVLREDIRDPQARRRALSGADAVVHLAAIVGDPACARDPGLSQEVNVEATAALVADAHHAGVNRFIFASTCSNYGRMTDPTVPITEEGELAPVSLYAEQKVRIERSLLNGDHQAVRPVCLRFATIYGAAPRMRFDLTVNEFARDLWADRELEVFGEQFWRPYVHVRDAARGVCTVLDAAPERVSHEVFNVGSSSENYRKIDLVEEIRRQIPTGTVHYVRRDEDPRDYKVSFEKISARLDFRTRMTVPDGIAEVISGLNANEFPEPFDGRYRNIP
ncbi:MAG: NAD(P)-dependent oxidoreductase [Solirubrobacterales bacterium]|nr:NAD(P)-dependent oxidoreductase [Solirubrobacterales bacterium]